MRSIQPTSVGEGFLQIGSNVVTGRAVKPTRMIVSSLDTASDRSPDTSGSIPTRSWPSAEPQVSAEV